MCHGFPEDSRTLVLAAVILSVMLTEDRTAEEIGRMAAFFTVLGDAMALLSLQEPCCPAPGTPITPTGHSFTQS